MEYVGHERYQPYSPDSPDFGFGVFQKDESIARRLREIIDNRVPDNPDEFYIIVKAEVLDGGDGSYFFELKDIVSETPSYFVRKRPKKQKLTF